MTESQSNSTGQAKIAKESRTNGRNDDSTQENLSDDEEVQTETRKLSIRLSERPFSLMTRSDLSIWRFAAILMDVVFIHSGLCFHSPPPFFQTRRASVSFTAAFFPNTAGFSSSRRNARFSTENPRFRIYHGEDSTATGNKTVLMPDAHRHTR